MIIDYLENAAVYYPLVKGLEGAIRYLAEVREYESGRYSNGTYTAIVQEDNTVDNSDSLIEAHRRYIDLQVVLSGAEGIGWNNVKRLALTVGYDNKKDVEFFQGDCVDLVLNPGMFYLCLPFDGHKCKGLAFGYSCFCRKICVKIPV